MVDRDPCPACGAPLGGRAGCQAAFDDLGARAWTTPGRAAVHNAVVDAYAMQHPEEYGRSAKSYAAHLVALGCGVEHPGDPNLYWAIARWLDGPGTLDKPALLTPRGSLTIADVRQDGDDPEYPDRVRQWAKKVWEAYADQQALARQWLSAARGAARS
jgi:hypothetical protein